MAFALPDAEMRRQFWQNHLPPQLPLANGVDLAELTEKTEGQSGREIKNAVLAAAMRAADGNLPAVEQRHFLDALSTAERSRSRQGEKKASGVDLAEEEKPKLSQRVRAALKRKAEVSS